MFLKRESRSSDNDFGPMIEEDRVVDAALLYRLCVLAETGQVPRRGYGLDALARIVAGIELDPDVPGFARMLLRPYLAEGLDYARATYATPHGEVSSDWRRAGATLLWHVVVPPNTAASIHVPSAPGTPVTEGGMAVDRADGLCVTGRDGGFLVCEAAAGAYSFLSTLE